MVRHFPSFSFNIFHNESHIMEASSMMNNCIFVHIKTKYYIILSLFLVLVHVYDSECDEVQVGDGETDHLCWQRPEDMTTSRRAYKVDEDNPGSEVAAETAAAMAAASIVFRKINPHYSHLLLEHAVQVIN